MECTPASAGPEVAPNVLLVEDSKFLRAANAKILTRAGYTVITAKDGEEAVRFTRERLPQIIILDLMLPKLPGLEVLRILKHDVATAHIPVIILSSLSSINQEKLQEDGAAAYLEKSRLEEDQSDLLIKTVAHVLRRKAMAAH